MYSCPGISTKRRSCLPVATESGRLCSNARTSWGNAKYCTCDKKAFLRDTCAPKEAGLPMLMSRLIPAGRIGAAGSQWVGVEHPLLFLGVDAAEVVPALLEFRERDKHPQRIRALSRSLTAIASKIYPFIKKY